MYRYGDCFSVGECTPTEEFPLERGLRQGSSLSSFLFLLEAEGLNVLMESMISSHMFVGYKIRGVEPLSISHHQFANDTLILGLCSCYVGYHSSVCGYVRFTD